MRPWLVLALSGAAVASLAAWLSAAPTGAVAVRATLTGYEEVPALSSPGTGEFRAMIRDATIEYTLSYSGLPTAAGQAHIHLGQRGVNGGVSAFLCGGGDKPACPPAGGTVEGIIDSGDVIGPAAQGIAAGEIDELIRAIRAGVTYVNVHTAQFPGGEIRGQIVPGQ